MTMVSIITATSRSSRLLHIVDNFQRQTVAQKELIIIVNTIDFDQSNLDKLVSGESTIRIFFLEESKTLGECLNFGVSHARDQIVAKFDDDDYYAPQYLENAIETLKMTNAEVVGKSAIFIYFQAKQQLVIFREHNKSRKVKSMKHSLAGSTLVWNKQVSEKIPFAPVNVGEDTLFQKHCLRYGLPLYSSDLFDYVYIRYGREHFHSWKINNDVLFQRCRLVARTGDFVPVISSNNEGSV